MVTEFEEWAASGGFAWSASLVAIEGEKVTINQAQIQSAIRDNDPIEAITELLAEAWTEGAEADDEYQVQWDAWTQDLSDNNPEPEPPKNPYMEATSS